MKLLNFLKLSVITAIFVMLFSCGGAEGRKAEYLASGKEYLEQNNLDKAQIEFKNVLQIDPKSIDGHYYMAQVQEKKKAYRKALGGYNKAIELKSDHVDALTGAGRIYMMANVSAKGIEFAEKALAIDSSNLDAMAVRAGSLYKQGDEAKALKDLRAALDSDPDHLASLALLSRIYVSNQQEEKAEALLSSSLQRQPDNQSLKVLLVQLYRDTKQFDKAVVPIEELIKANPDNLFYRSQLAAFYNALGQTQKAESVLRDAVRDLPDNMEAKHTLIQYLAEKRDIMFAQVELASFIKADENNPELQLISAMLYRQTKDNAKAESIYKEIIHKYGKEAASVKAQYELTRLLLDTKRVDEAKVELAKLLEVESAHSDGLTMRGIFALNEKRPRDAIADFRTVLKDRPQSVRHMKLLAKAHLAEGQFDLASEQLKIVLQLQPADVPSRIAFAKILHQDKQYTDAIEQLSVVLKVQPENIEVKDLIFKAYLAERNYAQALQLAEQMQKDKPDDVKGYFYHGLALQAQQKLEASMLKFDQALQINPKAIEPISSYVRAALASKQPAKAEAKLKSILKQHENHLVAQNLLGEVLLSQKKYKPAAEAFEKVIVISDKWWIPYRNLASTQILLNQPEKAISTFRQGMDKVEENEHLVTRFAALLEQQNKVPEAIDLYEGVLKKNPESIVAANNLALLLIEHQQDQPSKDRAMKLVNSFQTSKNPNYLDTLGWVHYKRGEFEKAISALLQADDLAPQQPLILFHLGKAYHGKGDKVSARKFLEKVANSDINKAMQQEAQQLLSTLDDKA